MFLRISNRFWRSWSEKWLQDIVVFSVSSRTLPENGSLKTVWMLNTHAHSARQMCLRMWLHSRCQRASCWEMVPRNLLHFLSLVPTRAVPANGSLEIAGFVMMGTHSARTRLLVNRNIVGVGAHSARKWFPRHCCFLLSVGTLPENESQEVLHGSNWVATNNSLVRQAFRIACSNTKSINMAKPASHVQGRRTVTIPIPQFQIKREY